MMNPKHVWILQALAAIVVSPLSSSVWAQSTVSPTELVRRTVKNELRDDHAKFMFRDQKDTPHGSQTKLLVQTKDAMAGMLIAVDGKPLGPNQRQQEQERLNQLASNPSALEQKRKREKEDADRVQRIMEALPDAFLYEEDGKQVGKAGVGKEGDELVRLKFRPNPKYDPPTHTEQVLTGMQGYMLIDVKKSRLAEIDGTLYKDVGFGWGILGHLDKGGRFVVAQGEVAPDHWDITQMRLDFTGKVLLFKSLTIKSNELYSDFRPVPPNLTFAQGVEMLRKQEETIAENHAHSGNTR
jgi:hypothetical protein